MHAVEMRLRSSRDAFAVKSTGTRNLFAEGGEMLRFTTGWARSGCDTVTVACWVSAPGGNRTVKSPAETVPPRIPMVAVRVVVVEEPPRRLKVLSLIHISEP